MAWKFSRGVLNAFTLVREFAGHAGFDLMGDGVVAGVLLKKSKAENSGWIVITTGWAMAVIAGGIHRDCVQGSRGAKESRRYPGPGDSQRGLFECALLFHRANAGRNPGSHAGVAALSSPLERNAGSGREAGSVLQFAGDPQLPCELFERSHCDVYTGVRRFRDFFKECGGLGSCRWSWAYLVGSLVWGVGLSLGGPTGYAINPARDLGPRIAHAILPIAGKGASGWDYALIPVFGPLAGGALAG